MILNKHENIKITFIERPLTSEREDMQAELKEVLWYCSKLAAELGINLEDFTRDYLKREKHKKN